MPPTELLISAGEASGDMYAARLASALRARRDVRLFGMGGPRMREAGVELLLHAYFLSAETLGDGVAGATFATVGGSRRYQATIAIDATADALVAHSAGVPTPIVSPSETS